MRLFSTLSPFSALWPHLAGKRPEWIRLAAATAAGAGVLVVIPAWAGSLARLFSQHPGPSVVAARLALGFGMILAAALATYARDRAATTLALSASASVRMDMARRVAAMNPETARALGPDLVSRISGDSAVLQNSLATAALFFVPNLAALAALGVAMLAYSPLLTALAALFTLPVALVASRTTEIMYRTAKKAQESQVPLVGQLGRMASAARSIKALGAGQRFLDRFAGANETALLFQKEHYRLVCAQPPLTMAVGAASVMCLVFVCVLLGRKGLIDSGGLASFLACLALAATPFIQASGSLKEMGRLAAVLDRMGEILGIPDEEDEDGPDLPKVSGRVSFDKVSFSYGAAGGAIALDEVSFTVEPGKSLGIVGESGAGKSTVISLLLRFMEPGGGGIFIDGRPAAGFGKRSLRKNIAVVFQEPGLLDSSPAENVALGKPDATWEEIMLALETADASEFASRLSGGPGAFRGENCDRLSAGQRQRVALAQALVRKAPILVLDEPTSALDNESQKRVARALLGLDGKATRIVAAHRLFLVRDFDSIMVLHRGRVAETGSHAELMEKRGHYYRLHQAQESEGRGTPGREAAK